jgi:hypothetical protein
LLYVLESLTYDGDNANPHWLPQFESCPFCSVNFTVYSKMEEMGEDTAYVMHKAKLFGKILPKLKVITGNTRGGSITVLSTFCLTGLEAAVR